MGKITVGFERQGVEVDYAGMEFFFDTNVENLEKFLGMDKEVEQKMQEFIKDTKHVDEKKPEDMTKEDLQLILEKSKEALRLQHDIVLGEGAFDKVYAKYPSIEQCEEKFNQLVEGLTVEVQRIMKEKERKRKQKLDKYNKHKK